GVSGHRTTFRPQLLGHWRMAPRSSSPRNSASPRIAPVICCDSAFSTKLPNSGVWPGIFFTEVVHEDSATVGLLCCYGSRRGYCWREPHPTCPDESGRKAESI